MSCDINGSGLSNSTSLRIQRRACIRGAPHWLPQSGKELQWLGHVLWCTSMLNDFATTKQQLAELADVINSFKSEAVQLKIVELVLGAHVPARRAQHDGGSERMGDQAAPNKPARKSKANLRPSTGPKGALGTLNGLVEEGYFASPRTVSEIVDHCKNVCAQTFEAKDISGKIIRLVRNKKLKREKNGEQQFVYARA